MLLAYAMVPFISSLQVPLIDPLTQCNHQQILVVLAQMVTAAHQQTLVVLAQMVTAASALLSNWQILAGYRPGAHGACLRRLL